MIKYIEVSLWVFACAIIGNFSAEFFHADRVLSTVQVMLVLVLLQLGQILDRLPPK